MKIRNGFVSNSSTSSFVCIGYRIKNTEENQLKLAEIVKGSPLTEEEKDQLYEIFQDCNDVHINEYDIYLGFCERGNENSVDEFEFDIDEISKSTEKFREAFGFGKKPKLYCGTEYC
jgi:hypothetical protein